VNVRGASEATGNIPLSVLDLAPISAGSDAATALRNAVDLAQHAERWGYRRYWIAEHHFVAVASSSPAVLVGQLAAATEQIRVGTAAVQLGHTTAVAVVEGFGILDAFHPGRIDLGVGRSGHRKPPPARPTNAPPKPPRERREVDGVVFPLPFDVSALMKNPRLRARLSVLQQPEAVTPDFADQVADILALLGGSYEADGVESHVVPGEGTTLWPWVFGSSKGESARVAGALGLPFVASYHITPATALEAVDVYRDTFQPSARLPEPYVVVSADIVVADDTATARHLASTYGHWVYSIRAGDGAVPYPDPDSTPPLTPEQVAVVSDRIETQFVGDPDEVAHQLSTLQRLAGADELVVTSVTHRHADRLRSHELIAKRWGLQ
jgi:alkanesulfonate monooxygenase SsuD/methylene tetrahydromethanopterin reductase-like flavin-dependent oxidoreductase (luciferase family)